MSTDISPSRPEDFSGLVIETPRLVLRQPTRDDASRLAALANNSAVAENLGALPHPYTLSDALIFIDNSEAKSTRVGLGVYAPDDGLIGMVSLMPRNGEKLALGYWIGEPFWGRGYATEATQAMIDLAFERMDAPHVAASTRVTNAASRRVLEKSGFQFIGQGMGPSLYYRGMVPVDQFRIDRAVWRSLKAWRSARVGAAPLREAEPCL